MLTLPIPPFEQCFAHRSRVVGWPPEGLIWVARIESTQPSAWPPFLHAGALLLLIESGFWSGSVGRLQLRVPAGDAVLVLPGDLVEDRLLEPVSYLALHLTWSVDLVADLKAIPRVLPGFSGTILAIAMRLLVCLRQRRDPAAMRESILLGASVITATLHTIGITPPAPLDGDLVPRLFTLVRADSFTVPSIAELAHRLDTSERTLRRNCQRDHGLAPLTLLRHIRLEVADERLCQSADSITDIASRLGFASPRHFSRMYQLHFGVAPSTARGSRLAHR